ncbi:MAG TPA: AAA family ATPase, partial [Terriglobales bacterium]|nr:AAA family ATPase [Terriglobales bacterium]
MTYRFGSFDVNVATRELRDRDSQLRITPKDFDVLVYLIRCRDRIASKAELLDQFWPSSETFEGTLTSTVSRLRRLLGTVAIEAVRGRGYRFCATIRESDSNGAAEQPPQRTFSEDFVGRRHDLTQLQQAIDAVRHGVGGVVLLGGEAGLGKSRLLEEAIRYARSCGLEALSTRAGREEGQIAYRLWRDLLDQYVAARPEVLASDDAVASTPELQWSALESSLPATGGAGAQRLSLFDSVTGVFLRAATRAPLLLAFDDLHAADIGSLQMLAFATRRCAATTMLIIATYRESELESQVAEALAAVRRDPCCTVHPLTPLSADEATEYLDQLAGASLAPTLRTHLIGRGDGNPFLLRECWRQASEGQPDGRIASATPTNVPNVVADLFEPRVGRLSAACGDVLEIASIWGREIDMALAQSASGYSAHEFADALDEARHSHFVVPVRGRSAAFRFSHQLVRDFIYHRCTAEKRRRHHRRAAELLDAIVADDADLRLGELANHWALAADDECAEQAIDRLQELGNWTLARLGFEDAIRHLERCLVLLDRYRPEWHGRRWQVRLSLAEALDRL